MELKIYNPTEDGFIKAIEWNHEEIKKEVSEKVAYYKSLVYTDEQIKDAKNDRATLNKFVSALETKRKEIKKQCLAPYEDFEKQMKEIIAIVNEPIALIDSQVKEYEEQQKMAKLEKIKEYWESCTPPFTISLEKVFDEKWLNASVSMKKVQEAIDARLEQIAKDFETIELLPEFSFEAKQVYISTLDVNKAISEAHRMAEIQKAKAAHEAEMKAKQEEQARLAAEVEAKQEELPLDVDRSKDVVEYPTIKEPTKPQKQWISFSALLSTDDALALKAFFESRNIEFKSI